MWPDPRAWGFHAFAFLPKASIVVVIVMFALSLIPRVAGLVANITEIAGRHITRPWVAIGLAAAAAGIFYFLRPPLHFLGDGVVWQRTLGGERPTYNLEPLAATLMFWLARAWNPALPQVSGGIASVLCGPLYVLGAIAIARQLWPAEGDRGIAVLLLLCTPLLLLFFGYVESYPLLLVVQVVFLASLVRAMERPRFVVAATALLSIAIATHLMALSWLPALWVATNPPGARSVLCAA